MPSLWAGSFFIKLWLKVPRVLLALGTVTYCTENEGIPTTGLPQAKSFSTHLLSPRDETNKGQAGKKERIDLRLRDGSHGSDLPRVIESDTLVQIKQPVGQCN